MECYFTIGVVALLVFFYLMYGVKMMQQRKQGIQTNQMGVGKKERRTLMVEKTLRIVSWLIVVVQIVSIVMQWSMLPDSARFTGILLGAIGDIVFGISVYTMRDSWRAGIPETDKTTIVTEGIYRYSRNPAFFGFFCLYIGVLLTFFNIVLLVMTCITILTFHLQVREEERFLEKTFGEEYLTYKKKVFRYLGRK